MDRLGDDQCEVGVGVVFERLSKRFRIQEAGRQHESIAGPNAAIEVGESMMGDHAEPKPCGVVRAHPVGAKSRVELVDERPKGTDRRLVRRQQQP